MFEACPVTASRDQESAIVRESEPIRSAGLQMPLGLAGSPVPELDLVFPPVCGEEDAAVRCKAQRRRAFPVIQLDATLEFHFGERR